MNFEEGGKKRSESDPGDGIKKVCAKKKGGYPRIEKGERKTQNKDVVERMMDEISKSGSQSLNRVSTRKWSKPLRERTNVRAKEGVYCVGKCVVRAKPSIGDGSETQTRGHGIHQVRTRAWHRNLVSLPTNNTPIKDTAKVLVGRVGRQN